MSITTNEWNVLKLLQLNDADDVPLAEREKELSNTVSNFGAHVGGRCFK